MDLVTEFPSQVHVYVCAQNTGSFHPKVYLFINSDDQTSWLSVGSSNLTHGGMNTNVEANLISTDWDDVASVYHWWSNRPDSVRQLRLTPHHLGTEDEPGPLRDIFRTEEAISNQAQQSGDTAANDLQLIVNHANHIVNLDDEEEDDNTEDGPEYGAAGIIPPGIIQSLFIKRIAADRATKSAARYMNFSISVVEDGFFGSYPLPEPGTGTGCIGRLNLNVVLNNNEIGARIDERVKADGNRFEGARFRLDGYSSERFNQELPTGSFKLFIRTTNAFAGQIYLYFVTPTHSLHQQIEELFEQHENLIPGGLPKGHASKRWGGALNTMYLRHNSEAITRIVNEIRNGSPDNFNGALHQALQADPDLQNRIGD